MIIFNMDCAHSINIRLWLRQLKLDSTSHHMSVIEIENGYIVQVSNN